ncbi:MAG: hypothetical protein ACI90U_000346 [Pseudomonadales bacterium]|jgi:hypothetical protein
MKSYTKTFSYGEMVIFGWQYTVRGRRRRLCKFCYFFYTQVHGLSGTLAGLAMFIFVMGCLEA